MAPIRSRKLIFDVLSMQRLQGNRLIRSPEGPYERGASHVFDRLHLTHRYVGGLPLKFLDTHPLRRCRSNRMSFIVGSTTHDGRTNVLVGRSVLLKETVLSGEEDNRCMETWV